VPTKLASAEMNRDLVKTLVEAMETLLEETGLDAEALFGERILEAAEMSTRAAHAAGIIKGAAIALGVTALELLDEVGS
jgi:hypothetical protein